MDTHGINVPDRSPDGSTDVATRMNFDGEAIVSADNPKIVDWEDLQQELARLWSLSSALGKAKERKASLARRLESIIEVRKESLRQHNELEEMKQKLEVKRLALASSSVHFNKTSENVKNQKDQLSAAIRMLLVGGKTLDAAHQQLQEANRLLSGERGHGNLKNLQKLLRLRQQHMIIQVSTLYPVKGMNEQAIGETIDSHSDGYSTVSRSPNESRPSHSSSLTILGLQLTILPSKKKFFGDKKEVQKSASALGYVAHAVSLISSYLDVPLRYPLRLGGSRSYIHDYAPLVEMTSSDLVANPALTSMTAKPTEFPLFLEGQYTTRATYAIFLLNKVNSPNRTIPAGHQFN
ncbi:UV radiation resistance [Musa troglodytarum]|uniref:UV radiation resistance n=1 Tax=Musa troglodytarum TaxID=320322 RepID=A0A9E7K982_9LILI|nr:UV radiation resistance [Musa troglodytarum]